MSYTVLARKYRSATFSDVIGQEPIAATLANAIQTGRIAHGYLFTGARGTGKTSMARILAKSVNCLSYDQPTITPCLKCDSCRAIAEGQDIDVIEIDAASHTGVDNIRELRSNAAYRPARSRFKIYIIDEVHMLSTGAFNALLKTLEEPPGHVKFILATTELQKVPATIQSRCQRFQFRNIGPAEIAARLAEIVRSEGATVEPAVLRRVARLANGSMRDALSILDQLMSVAPDRLTAELLNDLVPPPQDEQMLGLLELAAQGDAAGCLKLADTILSAGKSFETFCTDLIETLRGLLVVHVCGLDSELVDIMPALRDTYANLGQQFQPSQYVQVIAMVEELRRNVRFSGAGRALTDALLVRLANLHAWAPIEQLIAGASPGVARPTESQKKKIAHPSPVLAPPPSAGRAPSAEHPASISEPMTPQPALAPSREMSRAAAPIAPVTARSTAPQTLPGGHTDGEREPRMNPATRSAASSPAAVSRPAAQRVSTPASPRETRAEPPAPPITLEDRARAMQDPLVNQVVELFDGMIVHIDRVRTPGKAPA